MSWMITTICQGILIYPLRAWMTVALSTSIMTHLKPISTVACSLSHNTLASTTNMLELP